MGIHLKHALERFCEKGGQHQLLEKAKAQPLNALLRRINCEKLGLAICL